MPSTTTLPTRADGVTVVLPVRNGEPWLIEALEAILSQDPGRAFEVIVVEDGSSDGSPAVLARFEGDGRVRIVGGPGRGAAAAVNLGVSLARYALIAQIDQDVVIGPRWLATLGAALEDPHVGAVQGYYETDPGAPIVARVMGLDLELRYGDIGPHATDHVCTGNTVYRAAALDAIGGFDESFGYGYDNDASYRLATAGFRLVLSRDARSRHYWREDLAGYLVQQYGVGYGRIEIVVRHPARLAGDAVSPALMMLHPLVLASALAAPLAGVALGVPGRGMAIAGLLIGALATERAVAGVRAWRRFGDAAALTFPFFHLLRDLAWVAALAVWTWRRLWRRPPRPGDSMRPRQAGRWSDGAV